MQALAKHCESPACPHPTFYDRSHHSPLGFSQANGVSRSFSSMGKKVERVVSDLKKDLTTLAKHRVTVYYS